MDIIRKLILKDHPDFDFDRHRFSAGDIVETKCGAVVVVRTGGLDFIEAYVYKRSIRYREFKLVKIPYEDLPYYKKGEFVSKPYKLNKKLKWQVGDIVLDPTYGTIGYLFQEVGHQRFYMFVLESDNSYYTHTGVYIENPYAGYVLAAQ